MKSVRFYLMWFFLKAVALLPFCILYLLSDVAYLVFKYLLHYRYPVIKGNLERSFPEKDEKEIQEIIDKYYHHLSDIIFEIIKLIHVSDKQMRKRAKVVGGDIIEQLAEDGRPIILFMGHYGNWEWAQEISHYYRRPAFSGEIYRPVRDKAMNEIMRRVRARYDTILIAQDQAIRTLLRMNMEGKQFIVGFISDQRPNSLNLHHWTTFLNQDTAYAIGGEELGRHLNANYVFLNLEKPKRGHYVMTFQKMDIIGRENEDYPYTIRFLELMEQSIRKAPEYWLWSHNRWEFDREGNTIHKK